MRYLVCGLPGTGKTTYVKNHMGNNGLCYDLDAIAAAFRLRDPHEERHDVARHLANQMLIWFCSHVTEFTREIYFIRTAPRVEEFNRLRPDRVIMCSTQYVSREPVGITEEEIVARLDEIKAYCHRNNIPVVSPTDDEKTKHVMPLWAQEKMRQVYKGDRQMKDSAGAKNNLPKTSAKR